MNFNNEHYTSILKALEEDVLIVDEAGGLVETFSGDGNAESIYNSMIKTDGFLDQITQVIQKKEVVTSDFVGLENSYYKMKAIPLVNGASSYAAIVVYDVTETAILENSFKENAIEDPVTGIYNRRYFFKELNIFYQRFIRGSHTYSTIMINVDNYDRLVELFGLESVESVFNGVVTEVKSILRGTDIFARVGQEDFILLLPDTPSTGALRMSERLKDSIEDNIFEIDGGNISITVSIGCSEVSENDSSYDNVVNRSEIALYQAKHEGGNSIKRLNYESWKK